MTKPVPLVEHPKGHKGTEIISAKHARDWNTVFPDVFFTSQEQEHCASFILLAMLQVQVQQEAMWMGQKKTNDPCQGARRLHWPGIEPGARQISRSWQCPILPLNHQCL